MKLFYAITKLIATIGAVCLVGAFLETQPIAAAIYASVAIWLTFKDGGE